MNPTNLVSGEKYLYTPVVPDKDFSSAEKKTEPEVLIYCHESPYERDYHLFRDRTGARGYVCLFGYIVKSQVDPYQAEINTKLSKLSQFFQQRLQSKCIQHLTRSSAKTS
ncbi:MAG: hypothetical protein PUP93_16290 [Rhizonema sp. NSF051]|nr:hypothetical protein [Rhizonema sp. NSF051]